MSRSVAVYLLLGDEERKNRGVKWLRKGHAGNTHDVAETSPDVVVSTCNSFALRSGRLRIVVAVNV